MLNILSTVNHIKTLNLYTLTKFIKTLFFFQNNWILQKIQTNALFFIKIMLLIIFVQQAIDVL